MTKKQDTAARSRRQLRRDIRTILPKLIDLISDPEFGVTVAELRKARQRLDRAIKRRERQHRGRRA